MMSGNFTNSVNGLAGSGFMNILVCIVFVILLWVYISKAFKTDENKGKEKERQEISYEYEINKEPPKEKIDKVKEIIKEDVILSKSTTKTKVSKVSKLFDKENK